MHKLLVLFATHHLPDNDEAAHVRESLTLQELASPHLVRTLSCESVHESVHKIWSLVQKDYKKSVHK